VPQLLKEFLKDTTIKFCGAAMANDVRMPSSYGIEIPSACDLQKIVPNPTNKPILSLYDLANATIGRNLEKKKRIKKDKKMDKKKEEEEDNELIFGWANVPLSFEQVLFAALNARLGFEIARSCWKLQGYNSQLIVSTFIRWMIVDVWLCESLRFLVSLIVILLDEYNVWKNVLPLFRLTSLLIFEFQIFQVFWSF
jgi:hypothetical protein